MDADPRPLVFIRVSDIARFDEIAPANFEFEADASLVADSAWSGSTDNVELACEPQVEPLLRKMLATSDRVTLLVFDPRELKAIRRRHGC
jgi:hypothetical protein